MENFIAHVPTKVHFGKGCVENLGKVIQSTGKNVLLVYGKGSVLKNGSYDDVIKQLSQVDAKVIEYGGIKSNPVIEDVDAAASLGIKENIDVIVAVGGGSVIDSAKIISVCIAEKAKGWDVMKNKIKPRSATPLIGVLTLAATGTEMNPVAVVQNHQTQEKIGYGHPVMYPLHSFLDPAYTLSVPANYTAYGVVDLVAHALENFFGKGEASLSDRFVAAIIQEAMEYGPLLLKELDNYQYRANIMWAATNALNGLTGYGRVSGDWAVHNFGHVLSLLHDTPHGASLSIVYPAWMKFFESRIPERISRLGELVFGTRNVETTIRRFEEFFQQVHSPVRLDEAAIKSDKDDEILQVIRKNKVNGLNLRFVEDDYPLLLQLMRA